MRLTIGDEAVSTRIFVVTLLFHAVLKLLGLILLLSFGLGFNLSFGNWVAIITGLLLIITKVEFK